MKSLVQKCLQKNDEKLFTQYLAAITGSLTFFIVGIYQGWPGPSLLKILSDEYPLDVNQEEASVVATIGTVGHVLGGFLASLLSDRIGRKNTIMCIGIPQIIWPLLIYLSEYSKVLLYIARVIGGMGEGASIALVPTYVAEIAVPKVRGILGGFTTAFVSIGILIINVAGSYLTLQQGALLMMACPVVFWILFMFMPESPYYYLLKNKNDKARESLKILRRKYDVEKELDQLIVDIKKQMSDRGTFKDLFCVKIHRKVFILVSLLRTFQVFTGFGAFVSYSQLLLQQTTNLSPVMGSSVLLLGGLIMVVAGSFYLDKVGRRPLFLISMGLCFLSLILMAIFLSIRDYTSIDVSSISFMPLVFILMYNIVFSGGLAIGVNIFIAEVYSANIKAKGMAIASIIFAVTVTGSTKLYQYTADYIGAAVPFYLFAGMSFIGVLYIYFGVPETRGKTLGMIQDELRGKRKSLGNGNISKC